MSSLLLKIPPGPCGPPLAHKFPDKISGLLKYKCYQTLQNLAVLPGFAMMILISQNAIAVLDMINRVERLQFITQYKDVYSGENEG